MQRDRAVPVADAISHGTLMAEIRDAQYTEQVMLRLTPGQKTLMHETAQRVGLSDASFARQAILMHIAFTARHISRALTPEDLERIQEIERAIDQ